MELTPGYKRTVVGVIPNDWNLTPFEKLFAFRNGINADKRFYGQGVPFINVLETITYSHIHGPEIAGRVTLPESVTALYHVAQGDVLFNRTSETQEEVGLAATYVGSERVVFGGFVIRGRPSEGAFDPVYSGYALRAPWIRSQIIPMGQGAIRANISQLNLGLVVAPLPPLHEQRAIAAALSDVDALLQALTRLIEKKRDLKQAAMQQLLSGEKRLPGFHGKPTVTSLGELGLTYGGLTGKAKTDFGEGTGRYVTFMNVLANVVIDCGSFERVKISPAESQNRVLKGDLLFNGSSETPDEVGMCAVLTTDVANLFLNSFCFGFRFRDGAAANSLFIAYFLRGETGRKLVKSLAQGSTRYNLSKVALLNAPFRLPPLPEQIAIAAVLSDMDAELAALEARRDKTRALKQAMMQELLTGRTRLVAPAVSENRKGEERTDGRQANIHFKRSVLAAEIIDRLHNEPTFGHVKFEKMIYLVEHLCDVDTGSTYHRDAAGPYDNRAIRSIDSQLRKQKWFDAQKVDDRYWYEPLANRGKHAEYFERYFGGIATTFDTVIETFRSFTTERCEIVATLFGAWRDLLQQNDWVSDDAIVNEVLNNWHKSKKRIPEERWRKALSWMRDRGFVPRGANGA